MPKNITQYELLISCPGDVKEEVAIIQEVIHKFNSEFSNTLGIMIQERYWKTDSYPSAGNKPQKILNKQFVDDCDAAVAIFWTRFGTPTDEYGSGTEEEIEKMIANNKQVFMYFSDVPVSLSESDNEQYEKIKEFKTKYKDRGLYWEYKTTDEFKELFYAHLTKYFLSLSAVEEISSAKQPDIEIKLIDTQNGKMFEETYKFKTPCGLITYRKLSEDDIFDDISDYVTIDDINQYNDALPPESEVRSFNEKQKLYENAQNNCYDFKLSISNIGNAKANEIYVDLYFPKEILAYYTDDADKIKEPSERPDMPENPIWKAIDIIEKKKRSAVFGNLDTAFMRADKFTALNNLTVTAISAHSYPFIEPYKFSLPMSFDYRVKDNQELSIHIDNLLHTRQYDSDKFSLIFTAWGEFEIKYSVMCEEWEKPIEGKFQLKVEY